MTFLHLVIVAVYFPGIATGFSCIIYIKTPFTSSPSRVLDLPEMRATTLLGIFAIVTPSVVLAAAAPDAELDYSLEARELERRKYSPTCNNCTLQTTSVLSCLCDQTANGVTTQVAASLDLNTCITNMDGILMWYPRFVFMFRRVQCLTY